VEIIKFELLKISDIILISALIVIFLIQLIYLIRYFRLARHKDVAGSENPPQVTIITSVRNEEEHIRQIVQKFNEQQFENYQILVINYCSEDNTGGILSYLAESNPRLKVTSLSQETRFSEKQAINIGLKGASSPWIILLPFSTAQLTPDWLTGMCNLISPETDILIGYSNVERGKGFRNLICRLERFQQFMISGAWTLAGSPFVYNENNVLFRKSMYFETSGFRHKLNRNFANLELIFNENMKNGKVVLSTNPDLAIREHVDDDRGDHIRLLKKGVQIRQSLSLSKKIGLFLDDLTRIIFPIVVAVTIILHPEYWITFSVLPFVYLILLAIMIKMLMNRLNERKIFLSSFVYILIKPILNWWFFWSVYIIHRRNRWN
jgi:Glycosyltransferases, probably involved in cell wall biogenesis